MCVYIYIYTRTYMYIYIYIESIYLHELHGLLGERERERQKGWLYSSSREACFASQAYLANCSLYIHIYVHNTYIYAHMIRYTKKHMNICIYILRKVGGGVGSFPTFDGRRLQLRSGGWGRGGLPTASVAFMWSTVNPELAKALNSGFIRSPI